jgi:predicted  nucleic acid-binding Zn-ribbon protein
MRALHLRLPPNLPTPQAEAFTAKHQAMANLKGQISAAELQISGYQQLANQATTEAEKRKVNSALRSLQSQILEAQSQINKLQQELQRLRPN